MDCYEAVRKIVAIFLKQLAIDGRIKDKKFDANQFYRMIGALQIAIAGERKAIGMDYFQDLDQAASQLLKENYEIVDPYSEHEIELAKE